MEKFRSSVADPFWPQILKLYTQLCSIVESSGEMRESFVFEAFAEHTLQTLQYVDSVSNNNRLHESQSSFISGIPLPSDCDVSVWPRSNCFANLKDMMFSLPFEVTPPVDGGLPLVSLDNFRRHAGRWVVEKCLHCSRTDVLRGCALHRGLFCTDHSELHMSCHQLRAV